LSSYIPSEFLNRSLLAFLVPTAFPAINRNWDMSRSARLREFHAFCVSVTHLRRNIRGVTTHAHYRHWRAQEGTLSARPSGRASSAVLPLKRQFRSDSDKSSQMIYWFVVTCSILFPTSLVLLGSAVLARIIFTPKGSKIPSGPVLLVAAAFVASVRHVPLAHVTFIESCHFPHVGGYADNRKLKPVLVIRPLAGQAIHSARQVIQ